MPAALKHLASLDKLDVTGILAKWSEDGLYYNVKVIEYNDKKNECKVMFEDSTISWIKAKDLHLQLSPDKLTEGNIICCICDDGRSELPNEIIMCDTCEQGYHVECHVPKIDRNKAKLNDEESHWYCTTCEKISAVESTQDSDKTKKPKTIRKSMTPSTKKLRLSTPKAKSSRKEARSTAVQIYKPKLKITLTNSKTSDTCSIPKETQSPKVDCTLPLPSPIVLAIKESAETSIEEPMNMSDETVIEDGENHDNSLGVVVSSKMDDFFNQLNAKGAKPDVCAADETIKSGVVRKCDDVPPMLVEASYQLSNNAQLEIATKEFADLISGVDLSSKVFRKCPESETEKHETKLRKTKKKASEKGGTDKDKSAAAY